MNPRIKQLVAGVALAGAVTVGTAGAAVAAEGGTGSTGEPSAEAGRRHPALRHHVRKATVAVVVDTLGVSREDLRAAMESGQSLTEYATSLGKDPAALSDALTDAATAKLDQLVADGRITAERAETAKSKLPERIDRLMNHHFGQRTAA
jgi:hypothetical protein